MALAMEMYGLPAFAACFEADRRMFRHEIDVQLRESRTRDVQKIAWILMFPDNIYIAVVTKFEADMQATILQLGKVFTQWVSKMNLDDQRRMSLSRCCMCEA